MLIIKVNLLSLILLDKQKNWTDLADFRLMKDLPYLMTYFSVLERVKSCFWSVAKVVLGFVCGTWNSSLEWTLIYILCNNI